MNDSFFGFDASTPNDDESSDHSEDDYDALNDLTFGEASRDWKEDFHENLVRLSECENVAGKVDDSDLDMNFSGVGMDNFDISISYGESESRMLLDPNVWASPDRVIPPIQFHSNLGFQNLNNIAQNFQNQFAMSQIKMCSLEEIEQNLMKQQQVPTKAPDQQQIDIQALMRQPPPLPPFFNHPPFPPPLNVMPPNINMLTAGQRISLMGQNPNHQQHNFNQRLVQEIQQNHPMLSHMRNNNNNNNNRHHNRNQNNRQHNGSMNMKDYDAYANLMSERDKQWLLNIQLLQLNAETPYINDYYFTMFREKQANKAHLDNQLNHPFSNPQGIGNRNGLMHNRERKISENKNNELKDQPARTYTPLQFENSLGKLQCGSVTAPRKIIDMDVVGAEGGNSASKSCEISTQRKSRQILLHVENLYELAIKLEDLKNPLAIEAALVMKEKKERQAAERSTVDDLNNLSLNGSLDQENFEDLLLKLIPGLSQDKVMSLLMVRKGKFLLKRIQSILRDHPFRWNVWCSIFSSFHQIPKKDREDSEGLLNSLFTEFELHIQYSEAINVIHISDTFVNTDRILNLILSCKFIILSVLSMIKQMEYFYAKKLIQEPSVASWRLFLEALSKTVTSLTLPSKQILQLRSDSSIVELVRSHFSRFNDIDLGRFVALITVDSKN